MLPAIVEKDIENFGEAIDHIQKLGFKKREVEIQDPLIKRIMSLMKKNGIHGAGMSSFGPAVYGFAEKDQDIEDFKITLNELLKEKGGEIVITRARNRGYEIETVK